MYGGESRDDNAAMKAANNDMLGLLAYYNAGIHGLLFPLVSIIEYRGFRLIAQSLLPISKEETIKYGSADGGATIHADITSLNHKMKQAAEKINLKGTYTGSFLNDRLTGIRTHPTE